MVILLRRLAGLIVAVLLMGLAVPAIGLADGRAVIADYDDNGVIDACYPDADCEEALRLANAVQELYGAAVVLIERRQLECGPTVSPRPVTVADDEGGGGTLTVVVIVAVAAGLAAFAYLAWMRRRPGSGEE